MHSDAVTAHLLVLWLFALMSALPLNGRPFDGMEYGVCILRESEFEIHSLSENAMKWMAIGALSIDGSMASIFGPLF